MLINAVEYFIQRQAQYSEEKYDNLEIAENFIKRCDYRSTDTRIALAKAFKTLAEETEKAKFKIFSLILTCIVFPRPISSAKIHPRFSIYALNKNLIPSI